VRYTLNVDTTRSDIGSDHHTGFTITEALQRLLSLRLREVAVQ
jgi:hypothetical protein